MDRDEARLIVLSICGGICISLGGMAFLASNDRFVGSILFSVGLLSIVVHKFKLFTGVISYVQRNDESAYNALLVLLGNIFGVMIAGLIYNLCCQDTSVALKIVTTKMADPLYATFFKAMLCNMLIYLAVDEWSSSKNSILLILAVSTFVYCGWDHCIANMFYMTAACKADITFILTNIWGNTAGGILLHRLKTYLSSK